MSSDQPETREQRQFRAYAKRHVPRPKEPPLIAPRLRKPGSDKRLPSLQDLQLLKEGRGVNPPPKSPQPLPADTEILFKGRVLQEYQINRKTFVMQRVEHEGQRLHHRTTAGNRKLTYELDVAQTPQRARACGNGPRSSADRRPVDPPPVVRLRILEGGNDITAFYEATFILFASLEHSRPVAKGTMYNANHCPVLTGATCAGAAYLTKPTTAAYFIFPDLSVRHEGWYRIKFHLFEQTKRREDFDMDRIIPTTRPVEGSTQASPPNHEEMMINMTYVYTDPFQVYSAKKFPGLGQSTQLSQIVAAQGCRVRIRREVRQRKGDSKAGKKEEDQRSIRALSHDRVGSVDGQSYHGQHPALDTRRPSMESQVSQNYGLSRQPSFTQSAIPSPNTAGPSSYYGQQNHYDPTGGHVQYVTEPEEMWNPSYRAHHAPSSRDNIAPLQYSLGAPTNRPSYPPVSPATSLPQPKLPSIEMMTNPTEPPKPEGGIYKLASPVAQKRIYSHASEERSSALKNGARPQLTPSTRRYNPNYGPADIPQNGPLASGSDTIEADDAEDDDEEEGSDSYDELLNTKNPHTYKSSTGKEITLPRLAYGHRR